MYAIWDKKQTFSYILIIRIITNLYYNHINFKKIL